MNNLPKSLNFLIRTEKSSQTQSQFRQEENQL